MDIWGTLTNDDLVPVAGIEPATFITNELLYQLS